MHHHDAVTLEVTNIIFGAKYGNVRRFGHILRAFDVLDQSPIFMQDENSGRHRIHSHDITCKKNWKTNLKIYPKFCGLRHELILKRIQYVTDQSSFINLQIP